MSGLALSVSYREGSGAQCTIARLTGEADVSTPALHDVISAEVAKGPRLLLVDISGLTFLDSYRLHVLIAAYQQLHQGGCTLALVGPSGSVARMLQISGADQVIPGYTSADEALTATAAGQGAP